MAARVSTSVSRSFGPPLHEVEVKPAIAAPSVLSVSPRLVHAEASHSNSSGEPQFPLVEPIRADHRAAEALISLIEMSRQTAMGLRELIEQGRNGERKATRAALHLQERLRLSARMLQAFQIQISRVEKGIDDLREYEQQVKLVEERLQAKLTELQAQAESVITAAELRLTESAPQTTR
jgi:hypothetical protein